jgi:hypothetical protein
MSTLEGLPYAEVVFRKDGSRENAGEPLRPRGVDDLVVISHGWHQDANDAKVMYREMVRHLTAEAAAAGRLAGRRLGVVGVFWPSDKYSDNLTLEKVPGKPDGGGAASAGAALDDEALRQRAREVAALLGKDPADFVPLTMAARAGGGDADALVQELRDAMGDPGAVDDLTRDEHRDLLDPEVTGEEIFMSLRAGTGGGGLDDELSGGAAAAGSHDEAYPAVSVLGDARAAVAKILNQFAYFELKKRAGIVGAEFGRLLSEDGLRDIDRLHLVGHSFGARLVTAAAAALTGVAPYSLTLLQGAFSHNSLGVEIGPKRITGAFRQVVEGDRVRKRIVVTQTWNDTAVGVAYALASRVTNTVAAGVVKVTDTFGGARDLHGGIGANGALSLKDGEWVRHTFDGKSIPHLDGVKLFNLKSDFITGHSDIRTPQIARVLLAAMA